MYGLGSFDIGGFGFDPTPRGAGGGVMPCLGCLDWRCMTCAHLEAPSSRHLRQHDRLAKGRQGWSLCHTANRAGWSPVLASLVMRNHLDSEFAFCFDCCSMLPGIGRIVGCWL
jgi:hypothetical protein